MSRATRANPRFAFAALAVALGACIAPPTTYLVDAEGGVAEGGGADGGGPLADADALDSSTNPVPPGDAVAPDCPANCTGGCDGTTCKVKCEGKDACKGAVACAPGMACIVDCSTGKACNSLAIDQNGASSLCLRCSNGKEACNSVTCSTASSCTKVCSPANACNSTCDNCATVAACP